MNNREDFNIAIMREIGLEVDSNKYVKDQDTGLPIQYRGKNVKMVEDMRDKISRNEIEFDPLNNSSLMNNLFDYYVGKMNAEDSNFDMSVYYQSEKTIQGKNRIEAKITQDGESKVIKSDEYFNDSLKYAEIITTLNNNTTSFKELDAPIKPRR